MEDLADVIGGDRLNTNPFDYYLFSGPYRPDIPFQGAVGIGGSDDCGLGDSYLLYILSGAVVKMIMGNKDYIRFFALVYLVGIDVYCLFACDLE